MKSLYLFCIIIISIANCFGQNSYPTTGTAILNSGLDRTLILKDGRSGTNWNYIEWDFSNGTRDWVLGRNGLGNFTLWREGLNEVLSVDGSGRMGIGTIYPSSKLHLATSNSLDGIVLHHSNGAWANIYSPSMTGGAYNGITQPGDAGLIFGNDGGLNTVTNGFVIAPHRSTTSGLRIDNNGNVGIGTSSPVNKLHVYEITQNALGKIETGGANTAAIIYKNNYEEWQVGNQTYGVSGFTFASLSGIKMTIRSSGNVGIGTTSPDAKLAVKGTVHANEVKVDLNVPGPDYVFEPDYKLSSLEEIKNYIDQNKHLPEVPSAKEMEKNGVHLGEMNMILLKKIEELTLYMIEQRQEIQSLKKEINSIRNEHH